MVAGRYEICLLVFQNISDLFVDVSTLSLFYFKFATRQVKYDQTLVRSTHTIVHGMASTLPCAQLLVSSYVVLSMESMRHVFQQNIATGERIENL